MLYTISEAIVFNSDDGTLTRVQDNDVVKLSIPAGRLLEVLLNAPNGFIDRESLLTEVWDNYGLRGSHGNLNQYISILRRTLAAMGCEELIVTVPKMGFRINPDIPVTVTEPALPALIDAPVDAMPDAQVIEPLKEQAVIAVPPPSTSFLRRQLAPILLFALVLGLAGFAAIKHREWSVREIIPIGSRIDENCRVLYLQNLGPKDREKMNTQVKAIFTENALVCDKTRLVLVDNYTSESTTNLGRTLLSFCRIGSNREVVDCQNFYYYDRRIQ
ncbi:transcriptional regulator [Enterobacter sp. BIGb0383]|uniref:winged helix-turn-helix domain-containing protein n=1 Tax=unclassified Enterobacter TaxID=2608935 RepID=UPI000F4901A5|nr:MULTISPECIES: winged helix-turn-helix domain-containing protein [unclassified Enterobacter]ROP59984.1 transcriptional regulator [Enterobacter sp. BIGb0383]ROS08547.1 transcriptional regulator [Enterobacter sp. BIGb0359]